MTESAKAMTIVDGNILYAKERVVVQQVNCIGKMGRGLALSISKKYPNIHPAYENYCFRNQFSPKMLGTILPIQTTDGKIIMNLFAQYKVNAKIKMTDDKALVQCFINLRDWCKENEITEIAIPYGIGCGLAGGDWSFVTRVIKAALTEVDVTLYRIQK